MRWILDKLKVMLVALVLISLIGPLAHVYSGYLASYWLEKSLNHTLLITAAMPDGNTYGNGSGVIVGKDGCSLTLVTAYHNVHVVSEGLTDLPLNVSLINGAEAILLKTDKENDLALLWFQDAGLSDCDMWTPAELALETPPLGATIWSTGFPSRVPTLSKGVYAGADTLRFVQPDDDEIMFQFSTGPGGSGGGIWYKGRLVSVTLSKTQPDVITSSVFGPSTKTLKEFLK